MLISSGELEDYSGGLFSYSFLFIFEFFNCVLMVGDVIFYFNFNIIFSWIEVGIFFLLGNVIVKIVFLVFLFMIVFWWMLFDLLVEIM